jgi:hypothetical protein
MLVQAHLLRASSSRFLIEHLLKVICFFFKVSVKPGVTQPDPKCLFDLFVPQEKTPDPFSSLDRMTERVTSGLKRRGLETGLRWS